MVLFYQRTGTVVRKMAKDDRQLVLFLYTVSIAILAITVLEEIACTKVDCRTLVDFDTYVLLRTAAVLNLIICTYIATAATPLIFKRPTYDSIGDEIKSEVTLA